MNMEEETRILATQDKVEILANELGTVVEFSQLVQEIVQDVSWLIERVRYHENEKNYYNQELQMFLNGKDSEL